MSNFIMCHAGNSLYKVWQSTAPHIPAGRMDGDDLPRLIQDVLEETRQNMDYQLALDNFRDHVRDCPTCDETFGTKGIPKYQPAVSTTVPLNEPNTYWDK